MNRKSRISKPFPGDPEFLERLRKLHPYKLFLYIAMSGMGLLFAFLMIGFISTVKAGTYTLPKYFIFSTLTFAGSSWFMNRTLKNYAKDQLQPLLQNLVITLLLGQLFIYGQLKGWKELYTQGIMLSGNVSVSYLYVLSGLHMVHVAGGILFLVLVVIRVYSCGRDAVKRLLYITDPFQKMQLHLLHTYWQFMDIIWILLFCMFLYPILA